MSHKAKGEKPEKSRKRKDVVKTPEKKEEESDEEDDDLLPCDPSLLNERAYRQYFIRIDCMCSDLDPETDETVSEKSIMSHASFQRTPLDIAAWMQDITDQFSRALEKRLKVQPKKPMITNPLL